MDIDGLVVERDVLKIPRNVLGVATDVLTVVDKAGDTVVDTAVDTVVDTVEGRNSMVEVTNHPKGKRKSVQITRRRPKGLKAQVKVDPNPSELDPSVLGRETLLPAQSMTCPH